MRDLVFSFTISANGDLPCANFDRVAAIDSSDLEPTLPATYGIIDLFAGPGGLGEGFASLSVAGHHPFRIGLSVEKESSAHSTLRLRAFLREHMLKSGRLPTEYISFHAGECTSEPDWASIDRHSWAHACEEARCESLGTEKARTVVDDAIDRLKTTYDDTILIGGPPCQAYSLVGRARQKGIKGYRPENDHRHFLFREYIRVLDRLRPAAFVMENVKGILSSSVQNRRVFEMLMEDLRSVGGETKEQYSLFAVSRDPATIKLIETDIPSDFIVRAEHHGVPQARHRVIIIGVRSDLAETVIASGIEKPSEGLAKVGDLIGTLPALRSGVTPARNDSSGEWRRTVGEAAEMLRKVFAERGDKRMVSELRRIEREFDAGVDLERCSQLLPRGYGKSNDPLLNWIENSDLKAVAQHEARGHMPSDLARYLFVSVFGKVEGRSPKARDFPEELAPEHKSWTTGKFADRFRVQLSGKPSTTITSHISKDGHYFIHPDPIQCRSLTVREAARLQTFPDDYLFLGNRTQQFIQVGNAVPPYLANQIARLIHATLEKSKASDEASSRASQVLVG